MLFRSLEGKLAGKVEDIAVYAENLSLKNDIVQSLTLQLADLQGSDDPLSFNTSSQSTHTLAETTRQLELLTVSVTYVSK